MVSYMINNHTKELLCPHQEGKFCDPAFGLEKSSNFSRIHSMFNFSRVSSVNICIYTIRIHTTVFFKLLLCVNFHENFLCYLPDMDMEYFGQGEARVWYSALKIFHSTGWLFYGMDWLNLYFKSLQTACDLLILGLPYAFIRFLPYSHSLPLLPPVFYFHLHCSFPTEDTALPRNPPQNLNQDINHTRSMQVVSYLLPSHYLLCLNIAAYFFLDRELDEGTLAAEFTLLSFSF